ncbi:MAG: EAL domain-containing protein [Pseudomonadota bacterium]
MQTIARNIGMNPRHSRFAVSLFVLLFLVSTAVGYQIYNRLVENEEHDILNTLNHIADIRSVTISAWLRERIGDATIFSGGRFLGEAAKAWIKRGAPEDQTKLALREQLKTLKATHGYFEAAILDADGNVRISTQDSAVSIDPVSAQTIKRVVATRALQISAIRPMASISPEKRTIEIVAPLLGINDRRSKITAVLLLRVDAGKHINRFIQSQPDPDMITEVLLVEIRGQEVTVSLGDHQSPYLGHSNILPISANQLIDAAKSPTSHFFLQNAQGGLSIAVPRKIENVPWFLVSAINQNAVRANVNRLAWIVVGTGAAAMCLLGMGLFLWWKHKESEFRFQALAALTERRLLQRQYDYLSKYANDIIILADEDGRILEANDKALQTLGYSRSDLLGQPIGMLAPQAARNSIEVILSKLRSQGVAVFESTHERRDGSNFPAEVSARAIALEGKKFIQFICRDITERKESERALRESRARLNGILESILDVVWSFSPDLSRLNYINRSVEEIYGYPASSFLANPGFWFDLICPDDRVRVADTLRTLTLASPSFDNEFRIIRRDGKIRWLHSRGRLTVHNEGRLLRIDGVATDITDRKDAEQQIQSLAYYDNVTTLPNRALMNDRLSQAIQMAARSKKRVAVLFMDLDNFKNINDSLGHQIGDMLLRAIGERLLNCVRDEDTVARIGGDEFLVVLPDIDKAAQAVPVANKILASTSKPFLLQGHQIHTTISIGISVYPTDGTEGHTLIKHADSALYQAKNRGRNNYQFFTSELNDYIRKTSTIERQLRHAMEAGQLSVWYQPQIDMRDGLVIGAEALLRWRQNSRDFLLPSEFVPVAEERGLISKLGEWVMREACKQCREWQTQGLRPIPISVNVSPIQLQQKEFVDLVTSILSESNLDPCYLELEITETAIMRRASLVAELAMRLRKKGVHISIDDFGTGYSSLSYLKHIPIDKIKVDSSFIEDMLTNPDSEAITQAIINLAHSLRLGVIAEGVESKAQLEKLRSLGCYEVQGYYYSSAVPAEKFQALLIGEGTFSEASSAIQ